jgi:mono/diheme cytochrome c family protein
VRRALRWLAGLAATILIVVGVVLAYVRSTGLSARATPAAFEAKVARTVRGLAISRDERTRVNPVPPAEEAVRAGLEHYADHCAICHANDGSGSTQFGRGMFPRPPDLRAEATQEMTDGELFYIIENGIRFTGMPAFGTGSAEGEGESWKLVHFIRRLPQLSEAEEERMKELNPRSPEEIRLEIEEEEFLRGGSSAR